MHTFPYLVVLLCIPLFGAGLVGLVGLRAPQAARVLALAATALELVFAVALLVAFKTHVGTFQFESTHTWMAPLGISFSLGVDGISLFLVLLTALIVPIVILGTSVGEKATGYLAWLLLLQGASVASFVSLDLMLFFFAFELTLVPSYFLIVKYGHERRAYAATKFFVMTFLGSAFLLVGILVLAFQHQNQTGVLTFSLAALQHTTLSSGLAVWLSLAFLVAFGVKAPIFPLHTWSPTTYREAPEGGSMVLSAILAKLGTYGILRFNLTLFPHASKTLAPLVLTLAAIGVLYGAITASGQHDMKRLIAYSSLAHVGFIILGTFSFSPQGLTGAVTMMVNHGIITAAFFMLIGWIAQRRGSFDTAVLKGLQGPVPVLAGVFTVTMLASIGLPGLNGFVGEFLVLIGTFTTHRWWAVVATTGVVVAAMYLLWNYQQVFHGKADAETETMHDLTTKERLTIAPLLALIVLLGVYPKFMLDRIEPSVHRELAGITAAAPATAIQTHHVTFTSPVGGAR